MSMAVSGVVGIDLNKAVRNALFDPKVQMQVQRNQPVFIWSMGKVGSTSVAKALNDVRSIAVFTSHFMNDPAHPRSQVLYKHLIAPKIPLKIISLVRDPISKNVSSFFQNYEKNTGRAYATSDFSLEDLNDLFFNKYQHHDSPLTWFDNYIKRYTGIDIYSKPFSLEQKGCVYQQDNFELLVMRCDLDDAQKTSQVEAFLNLEPNAFSIVSRNVGASKEYSKTYDEFKRHIQFPEGYLNTMRHSQYFQHFYSQAEIEQTLQRWA